MTTLTQSDPTINPVAGFTCPDCHAPLGIELRWVGGRGDVDHVYCTDPACFWEGMSLSCWHSLAVQFAPKTPISDLTDTDLEEDLTDLCAQMQEGGEWDKEAIRGLAQEMGRRERAGR